MLSILASVVDGEALWQTIWSGAVAGVGVSVIFAVTILGATRSSDMRRDERHGPAVLYAVLAGLGTLASFGAVVFGVLLITTK